MENTNSASEEKTPILILNDIYKSFGGIHALSGVSFNLRAGEIHALVGENGAGKSTLIKVITGAYGADRGSIQLGNDVYDSLTPEQAQRLGVGVVYQEFNILPDMSVAENIYLSHPPLTAIGLIDVKKRAVMAKEVLNRLGAGDVIDPNQLVRNLTVGEQQLVEIAKALSLDAKILIMDEPSAVLPSRDLDRLFNVIKKLRDEGCGIIYISHRLNEIFEIGDRVTVMKDGKTMGTKMIEDTNSDELVRMMVGRDLTDMYPPKDMDLGKVILDVKDLCVENTVFDVNFTVQESEIVGLAGLGGSGRTTVCRAMVGLADIKSGSITYLGKPAPHSPGKSADVGLVLVPEDRKAYGLVLNQSMKFNIALPNLMKFIKYGTLKGSDEAKSVDVIVKELDIRPANSAIMAENLSGGNQQKIVVGKWLMTNPKLVIFDEPTRGVDVGAKAEIYQRIRDLTHKGMGVIMASSELPELIGMCDRIIVFHEGRISGELQRSEFSEEAIMHLATASHLSQAEKEVEVSLYKKPGPYKIAVLQQDSSNGWGNTYNVTIQAYGKELLEKGILSEPLLTSSTNDADQQIADLQQFISQKPDAIVIQPLDRLGSRAAIKEAVDAGIPVVLCANGIEGEDFTCLVDIDFYEQGRLSGEGLAKLLNGKGNVILMNGVMDSESAQMWKKAALYVLERYPEIKIIAEETMEWDVEVARKRMHELIDEHAQIDGIWAGGGELALGAIQAYLDIWKEPPAFAMVNILNGFLRLNAQYKTHFMAVPDSPGMAKYGLQTAVDILQGKPVKKFRNVRDLMHLPEFFDENSAKDYYVPELNDDFVPPATVDIQYYLDGGFAREDKEN